MEMAVEKYGVNPVTKMLENDIKALEFARLGKLRIPEQPVSGIDILAEGWYLNGKLIPKSFHSAMEIENKFLLIWFWKNKNPKLYRQTHRVMDSVLKQVKYTGPLGIHCVISKDDGMPYFVRFSPKFSALNYIYEILPDFDSVISFLESGEEPEINPSFNWFGWFGNSGNGPTFEAMRNNISVEPFVEIKRRLDMLRQWNYF